MDPCPVLEVKEIPARKVDEGCKAPCLLRREALQRSSDSQNLAKR